MPRFVVLTHDHPSWHWDFMLEISGALRTWRLDADPCSRGPIQATLLPLHRLEYLEYEGPVSGGRGEVYRWDRGVYDVLDETPHRIVVKLVGVLLRGVVEVEARGDETWFCFAADD